jgi:hypothetical protein
MPNVLDTNVRVYFDGHQALRGFDLLQRATVQADRALAAYNAELRLLGRNQELTGRSFARQSYIAQRLDLSQRERMQGQLVALQGRTQRQIEQLEASTYGDADSLRRERKASRTLPAHRMGRAPKTWQPIKPWVRNRPDSIPIVFRRRRG